MPMKPGDGNSNKEYTDPCTSFEDEDNQFSSYVYIKCTEGFKDQIRMYNEENMCSLSHHHKTDTGNGWYSWFESIPICYYVSLGVLFQAHPYSQWSSIVFYAAMWVYIQVSSLFGLEVTWCLIQQQQQQEEKKHTNLDLKMGNAIETAFNISEIQEDNEQIHQNKVCDVSHTQKVNWQLRSEQPGCRWSCTDDVKTEENHLVDAVIEDGGGRCGKTSWSCNGNEG